MNDLKYFKQQTEQVTSKVNDLMEKQSQHDSVILAKEQEHACYDLKMDEIRKEARELRNELAEKDHLVK